LACLGSVVDLLCILGLNGAFGLIGIVVQGSKLDLSEGGRHYGQHQQKKRLGLDPWVLITGAKTSKYFSPQVLLELI
jgi:hypothetical protein